VVATIDSPASHHGTDRPDAKNSDVFFPARFPKNSAGTKQMSSEARTMAQSMGWRRMGQGDYLPTRGWSVAGLRNVLRRPATLQATPRNLALPASVYSGR
jgi:hypothetical protein